MLNNLIQIFGTKTKALEIIYLLEGLKPVVRHGFYEHELHQVEEFCKTNNLSIIKSPYKVVIVDVAKSYSNKGIKVNIDDPRQGMLFVYISKDEEKAMLSNIHETENNHRELGILLGYPQCCIDFFIKHEPEQSKEKNDYIKPILNNSEGYEFPFQNNIFIKDFDITLLNHFPCSLNCQNSLELAKIHLNIIRKYDASLATYFIERLKRKIDIDNRILEFI
ncbi:DUF483 domain-containing protein [Candidatus Woesearchaeota archaeon]|nr:DUF483 domain-containing protein [Candidatus Woesearchaeota archaeon]